MVTTQIQFKASKEMPSYNGYPDGHILDVEVSSVENLMKSYPGCFEFVKKGETPANLTRQLALTKEQIRAGYKINDKGIIVDKKGKAIQAPESNK